MFRVSSLVVIFCLICGALYAEPIVSLMTDKTGVSTGENFVCTVTVEGEFSSPRIELPSFEGLTVVSQNQTRSYRLVRGKAVLKSVLRLILVAYEPGSYTIGKVKVIDGEKEYSSDEVVISVKGKPLPGKRSVPDIERGAITL